MAAIHTPTQALAQGACEKAAGGDCKVGGYSF